MRLARQQTPLQVPQLSLDTRCLEKYFLLLSALEDNLVEFRRLVDTLNEVRKETPTLYYSVTSNVNKGNFQHCMNVVRKLTPTL